jgi:CTP-dependent riboflavin kinase
MEFLKKAPSIPIVPPEGFNKGKCFKACLIPNLKCAIVIPEIPNYPNDIIEIIAPINLRGKCQLQDGVLVEVKISR